MAHSELASPRATIEVLQAHGLYTRKALGQHFLVDDNIIGRILQMADLAGNEPVLEIGPGIGTLTVVLCEQAGAVVTVEQDSRLLPVLEQTTAACTDLNVVEADAVSVDLSDLMTPLGSPGALIANLPYGIAATVVLRLFAEMPSLQFAVVMVQAEVADRMAASPGGKEYGAYTVKLALHAEVVDRFKVPPTCFLPPPRVDSAVLRLERRAAPTSLTGIRAAARMADAAFAQRRKTIRNSLRGTLDISDDLLDVALRDASIDPTRRAETLSVTEYVALGASAEKYSLLP